MASRGDQQALPLQCVLVTVPAERCPSCAEPRVRHVDYKTCLVACPLLSPNPLKVRNMSDWRLPQAPEPPQPAPELWAPSHVHRQTEAQREGPQRCEQNAWAVAVTCYCHQSTSCSHHVCPHVMLGKFILKQIGC